jgi:hypothetical protein
MNRPLAGRFRLLQIEGADDSLFERRPLALARRWANGSSDHDDTN